MRVLDFLVRATCTGNILRSAPHGKGESSRFECRDGLWVSKIWRDNQLCQGAPSAMDTAPCTSPYCTCREDAQWNNKLLEFKMYRDADCAGEQFSTAAAVVDQCFSWNGKGYTLQCAREAVTRTEFDNTDCVGDGTLSDITPSNTDEYCYVLKCGTTADRFVDENGARSKLRIAVLVLSLVTLLLAL